jgi:hypothetical protein
MKKAILLILAVILSAAIFTSCNTEVKSQEKIPFHVPAKLYYEGTQGTVQSHDIVNVPYNGTKTKCDGSKVKFTGYNPKVVTTQKLYTRQGNSYDVRALVNALKNADDYDFIIDEAGPTCGAGTCESNDGENWQIIGPQPTQGRGIQQNPSSQRVIPIGPRMDIQEPINVSNVDSILDHPLLSILLIILIALGILWLGSKLNGPNQTQTVTQHFGYPGPTPDTKTVPPAKELVNDDKVNADAKAVEQNEQPQGPKLIRRVTVETVDGTKTTEETFG